MYINSSSCLSIIYSIYIQSTLIAALGTITLGPQRRSALYLNFIKNSVTFIVSVFIVLYTSYAASNNITQLSCQKLINSLRYCLTIQFRTSVYLSIYRQLLCLQGPGSFSGLGLACRQVLEAGYIFSAMPCCLEGLEFNVVLIYPLLSEDPLFTPLGSLPLGRLQCFYICRPSSSDMLNSLPIG